MRTTRKTTRRRTKRRKRTRRRTIQRGRLIYVVAAGRVLRDKDDDAEDDVLNCTGWVLDLKILPTGESRPSNDLQMKGVLIFKVTRL